jgi:hypothetical protein
MSPVINYKRVRRADSLSIAYLKLVYSTIYPELFPDASDRESWEQWMGYLDKNPDENFFILSGTNLDDPATATIHGFVIGTYFAPSQTGLICYIGVDKNCRAGGVASGLIDAVTAAMDLYAQTLNASLLGLFAEAHDPEHAEAVKDSLPPAVRLKIYHRWKALQVPVQYCYPSVQTPWRKEGGMVLLSLPVYGHYAEPENVAGMIADYYTVAGLDPQTDSDYARISGEIATWRGYISLAQYDMPVRQLEIA